MGWERLRIALARLHGVRLSERRRLALRCERLESRRVFADFGDAPEPYPTLLVDNGASHTVVPGYFLGATVDEEPDGVPSPFVDGDDQNQPIPDEDGVAFPQEFVAGAAVEIRVVASGPGRLSAWFDWNADGDWSDANETVFVGAVLATGESSLTVNVPANATLNTFQAARFRFSSQAVLTPTGAASDGEVEDWLLMVSSRPELRGRKFNDLDRDHEHDAGEPYLNGWVIEAVDSNGQVVDTATTADVDLNGDGMIDIDSERGVWRIFDLPAGDFTIREAARPEHVRTAPDLTAFMSGRNGPVPSGTSAVGFASFSFNASSFNASTNQVSFQLDYDTLNGVVESISLREGTATQHSEVVIVDLLAAANAQPGATGPLSGHFTLDQTSLEKLLAGNLYVTISTDTFPEFGELRGQVLPGRDYQVSLGLFTQLIGLDFGGYTAESRTTTYPATQGQVLLALLDSSTLTLPLVGSSTFKLYVANDGSAGDFDGDGRNEAALELTALALRGYSTLGRVDIALRPASSSTGLVEERLNTTPAVLDLPPFAASGSADQQLSFEILVTITPRFQTPIVLRSATPIHVAGVATAFPMAIGEVLAGTGPVDLVDVNGASTGLRLNSVSLSPSPEFPWRNPAQALDVDNSGGVEPLDALLIINELNNPQYSNQNILPRPVNPNRPPAPFLDVTGNNVVEPRDALLVINRLNGVTGEAAEGEAVIGEAVIGEAVIGEAVTGEAVMIPFEAAPSLATSIASLYAIPTLAPPALASPPTRAASNQEAAPAAESTGFTDASIIADGDAAAAFSDNVLAEFAATDNWLDVSAVEQLD
jgi:hypothetical protein